MNARNINDSDWEFPNMCKTASGTTNREARALDEERLIQSAQPSFAMSAELRGRVLAAASRAHRRGRRIARAQRIAATLLVCASATLCSSYSLARLQAYFGDRPPFHQPVVVNEHRWVPTVAEPTPDFSDSLLRGDWEAIDDADPRELVASAMRQPDSWALVRAYGAIRARNQRFFRSVFVQ